MFLTHFKVNCLNISDKEMENVMGVRGACTIKRKTLKYLEIKLLRNRKDNLL